MQEKEPNAEERSWIWMLSVGCEEGRGWSLDRKIRELPFLPTAGMELAMEDQSFIVRKTLIQVTIGVIEIHAWASPSEMREALRKDVCRYRGDGTKARWTITGYPPRDVLKKEPKIPLPTIIEGEEF